VTRPANPTYAVPTWAQSVANYPALGKDWDGAAIAVAPPGDYFTPEQKIAADYLNDLFAKALNEHVSAKSAIDALNTYVGQVVPLNFKAASTAASNLVGAHYNPYTRRWSVFGSTDRLRSSTNEGETWSGADEVSGGTSRKIWRAADDGAGNVVATTDSRDVYTSTGNGAWTKHTNAIPTTPNSSDPVVICYESGAALWCVAYRDNASSDVVVATSPDGTTWTARTLPAAWSGPNHQRYQIAAGGGRVVLMARDASTATKSIVATSDDGGVTWAAQADLTHVAGDTDSYVSVPTANLAYDSTGKWMYSAANYNGNADVFHSTDGATWTAKKSIATDFLSGIVGHGAMWLALLCASSAAGGGAYSYCYPVYSLDNGATWFHSGHDFPNVLSLASGNGGVLALFSGSVRMSLRTGAPGVEVQP